MVQLYWLNRGDLSDKTELCTLWLIAVIAKKRDGWAFDRM